MDRLLKVNVWLKDQSQQEAFDPLTRPTSPVRRDDAGAYSLAGRGVLSVDCGVEVEAVGYVP